METSIHAQARTGSHTDPFPLTAALARWTTDFDETRLEPRHFQAVGHAVIDTCAVALAGCTDPASTLALRYARGVGAVAQGGGVRCWGRPERLPLELAAFCNAVSAHALDYDDVASVLRGHPSVAMLPALLALGEHLDLSGRRLTEAYVVGFDAICRLARLTAQPHYAKGWHATATLGGLGCAVACARLLKLDASQTEHAIGLAVAQVAGSRANFGSHAKSLQAGHANQTGLRAALLASEGFEASPGTLEGPFGFLALYGAGTAAPDLAAALTDDALALDTEGLEVKKYPSCYATHRPIDALLLLRERHSLVPDDVKAIRVTSSAGSLAPLIHPHPHTGLEAKFSLPYTLAAALVDGKVSLTSFQDVQIARPEVQRLLHCVSAKEGPGGLLPRWCVLEIDKHNGETLFQRMDSLHGSPADPLSTQELQNKLHECASFGEVQSDLDGFFERAQQLETISVREIVQAL